MKTSTLFRGLGQWLNPVTVIFIMILLLMALATSAQAQNVNIPDVAFKTALLANTEINTTADGEITLAEAQAYTGIISVANKGIADLTGIEAFTELTQLICNSNSLTSLDLSANTQLVRLNCGFNSSLGSVDLSNNPLIINLDVSLTGISSIDLTDLPKLESLNIRANSFNSLDITDYADMKYLNASANNLSSIELLSNPALNALYLSGNPIEELDVSQNPDLAFFEANNVNISSIDLSGNPDLFYVSLVNNSDLTQIDIRNGNNDGINSFNSSTSTDIECIAVDKVSYSSENWTVDDVSVFKLFCDPNDIVSIPDDNFKTALLANSAINTVDDREIRAGEAQVFSGTIQIDQADGKVADLTGIQYFSNLEVLTMISHDINEFDATNHPALRNLILPGNNLSAIDITTNPSLTFVNLQDNQITSIDVDNNVRIRDLKLNKNLLTEIDVTKLTLMRELTLGDNDLTEIDVSQNPDLVILACYRNELNSLDLANGNNTNIISININDNPNLTCISVDNPAYSRENWTSVDDPSSFKLSCDPNDPVNIPDNNFKAALLANANINTTADNEITYGEADAYTGNIIIDAAGIADATGIEAFENIFRLQLIGNNLTEIDLFHNTSLTGIFLDGNPITNLDLTQNTSLRSLSIGGADMSNIDLSKNILLKELFMNDNLGITSLNLTQNPLLEEINAKATIDALDISDKTALKRLILFNTEISTLDLSNSPNLTFVNLQNNSALTSLNIRNGSNELMSAASSFRSIDNTSLSCIRVDDPNFSTATWTNVDDGVEFKLSCDPNDIVNIPDDNFKRALLANSTINTADDGEIRVGEAEAFSGTIQVNKADGIVADLTGIEYFSNLEVLIMIDHDISEFDATKHPALRNIVLPNNNLSEIDITANPNLTFVNLGDNQIGSIDVENNVRIRDLKLSDNLLTEIDVTNLSLLRELTLGDNELTEINVTQNPDLVILDGYRNNLGSIDITQNTALKYLNLFETNLTSIDVTDQPDLLKLSVGNNDITSLDLSVNVKIEDLKVINTGLTSLNLAANNMLKALLAQENQLTSLNLANGNNTAITSLNISDNSNLTCITVDDVAYAETNFTNIDEAANFSTDCSNVANDIISFSITEQVGPAVIEATAHTVLLEVPVDTDLSSLTPTITLSEGAVISPESAVAQDFSGVVTYTVTAENPTASQEWLVTVREENAVPTALELTNNTITEGNTLDAVVGNFISTDIDPEDTHSYSLVSGEGDTDNATFDVSGSNLIAKAVFNFDTKTSYNIRASTNDGNGGTFEARFTISILDFTKSNQSITFSAIADKTYGDDRITLGATASSGLPVTYTITRGADLVSLSGNRLTLVGVGDVTVRADQAGNATFNPSASAQQNFTVDPATLTVTAKSDQMIYGDDLPVLTASYSGFVDNEDAADLTTLPTIFTTATATSNVGDFAITANNAAADNYIFSYVAGALSIGKAPLTVTANDLMMVYGGAVPELTVAYDGFVNEDSEEALTTLPASSTTAMSTSAIGDYPIAVADAVAINYEITYVAGNLSISEAVLTLTADDQAMIYGADLPVLTYTAEGFVGADDITVLTATPSITTAATSQSNVDSYDIVAAGATAPNYTVEYAAGNLEIGKAALLAKVDAQSITFGDDLPELTFALSGFVNSDDADALEELPTITSNLSKDSDAGTYPIEVSGGTDSNYDFTYENAELTIEKAAAQIIVGELEFTSDGQPKLPTITTDPEGLEVDVAINDGKDAPTEPGIYNVVITIVDTNYEGQVSGTLTINAPDALGIERHELPAVFPNPTRNVFTVGKEGSQIERLILFDLDGRKRKEVERSNNIDVSDQREGIYLLWVYETNGTATYQKVIRRD